MSDFIMSKSAMLSWVKDLTKIPVNKLQDLSTGVHFCVLLNIYTKGKFTLQKINYKARLQYEGLHNLRLFQYGLEQNKILNKFDISLIAGKNFKSILETLQWFRKEFSNIEKKAQNKLLPEKKTFQVIVPLNKTNTQEMENVKVQTYTTQSALQELNNLKQENRVPLIPLPYSKTKEQIEQSLLITQKEASEQSKLQEQKPEQLSENGTDLFITRTHDISFGPEYKSQVNNTRSEKKENTNASVKKEEKYSIQKPARLNAVSVEKEQKSPNVIPKSVEKFETEQKVHSKQKEELGSIKSKSKSILRIQSAYSGRVIAEKKDNPQFTEKESEQTSLLSMDENTRPFRMI